MCRYVRVGLLGIFGVRGPPCQPSKIATVSSTDLDPSTATGLATAGVTVVSGLARGIDSAAHRAAVAAGGRTFAVMATGLATVYPPEHAELADDVSRHGAIMTEFPLDQAPLPGLFPQRNRIISALSFRVRTPWVVAF